jgi:carbamoyl-phosphate synthase small subunit
VHDKKIIFENGKSFIGNGFGSDREAICEVVFNTSMIGYQEIISDLSYYDQIVCMTYPLIGNYGLNDDDYETRNRLAIGGLIVRECNNKPSHFQYTKTLHEALTEYDIPGVDNVDTREITHILRSQGSMYAIITDVNTNTEEGIKKIKEHDVLCNHVEYVSCKKLWRSRIQNPKFHVVIIDCGIKRNIIRILNQKKCNITVVPFNITYDDIVTLSPDGVLISNGPGDPRDSIFNCVIDTIQKLQGNIPIFGICLGHQLIALANGAKITKLTFGHHGSNHPVKNLKTGKVEITAQNHSYVVCNSSIQNTALQATHLNLLDKTIEGLYIKNKNIFSVQYHPESAPGPHDSFYLFDQFIKSLQNRAVYV